MTARLLGWVTLRVAFYNLRVGRSNKVVADEIEAILATGLAWLGLCEAIGYRLPDVPGYQLLRDIRTTSRANVAAYVRDDLDPRFVRWHDLHQTWSRTEHAGTHEPRSFLEFIAGRIAVNIGHQAPKGTDNTPAAQTEGVELMARRLAPWQHGPGPGSLRRRVTARRRPRMLFWDANRKAGEPGPGPSQLAERIGGSVAGGRVDCAVVRRARVVSVRYVRTFGGIVLGSDHRDALVVTLSVRRRWTLAPKEKP